MTARSNNPISIQSRELIIKSLFEIMKVTPFQDITIKEITYGAQLVRRTFYAHFKTKEEVIEAYMESIFETYNQQILALRPPSLRMITQAYFELTRQHAGRLQILKANNKLLPARYFEKHFLILDERYDLFSIKQRREGTYPLFIAFLAGGMQNLVNRWLDNIAAFTPNEMTDLYLALTQQVTEWNP